MVGLKTKCSWSSPSLWEGIGFRVIVDMPGDQTEVVSPALTVSLFQSPRKQHAHWKDFMACSWGFKLLRARCRWGVPGLLRVAFALRW